LLKISLLGKTEVIRMESAGKVHSKHQAFGFVIFILSQCQWVASILSNIMLPFKCYWWTLVSVQWTFWT